MADSDMVKADGGFASRKLWYAIGTSVLIFLTGLLAAYFPMFRPGLETVVGGELGALALYLGGNVGTKFALVKNGITSLVAKAEQTEDDNKDK